MDRPTVPDGRALDETRGREAAKGHFCMDELAMLDRETFAQVWSRVDPQGTAPVEPDPGPASRPEAELQALVGRCLADAEAYWALRRRARRAKSELAALQSQKTAQAKRLSAAYFLRSGVHYWPKPALAQGQGFFAALRQRYQDETQLAAALETLARTAPAELADLYAQLAQETARMARQLQTVVQREL